MNTPNHQKGISTLIAAVLLIAVTLLISLIVSTSFTSLVKTVVHIACKDPGIDTTDPHRRGSQLHVLQYRYRKHLC
ncbi:MAG: hypothetical protein J4469_05240 [Candidatus Aenigmarchaeota archaeon]|nr:hypothetical protein [Candidatus Aenigmarchaeota archaeon]